MSKFTHEQLRKRYKQHWQENLRVYELRSQAQRLASPPMVTARGKIVFPIVRLPEFPAFPEECRDMTCGAKTRARTQCKLTSLYSNGRCKFHGGMSTGPKTVAGKAKSAQNGTLKKAKPMKS